MSEAFQAAIFHGTVDDARDTFRRSPDDTVVVAVRGGLVAVSPPLGPTRELDALVGAALAIEASRAHGSALHVMYDSRISFRHSQLFRSGEPTRLAFGAHTERWRRLRDEGAPIDDLTYGAEELDSQEEYESAIDALTQGLRALGAPDVTGPEVVQLLCYGVSAE